ncbi:MAG TPA: cobalamin biosynthesis protein [Roseiarcus sp.]|nr:cobalamin biosynthesis protein [Roseiarcus sp.]
MSAMVGIGCRAGASAAAIARRIGEARARAGVEIAALHTAAGVGAPALAEAAARLGLPLHRHDAAALARVAGRVVSHSARVEARFGVGSVAEAAALAGAGEGAKLIVAKFSAEGVSCAVATS